jgi:hypothetical protein
VWAAYDLITELLLEVHKVKTRILFLYKVDRDLLVAAVYMQQFPIIIKLASVITRHVQDGTFGTATIDRTNH